MKRKLRLVFSLILAFGFIFTTPSVAFAVEEEEQITTELVTRELYNAPADSAITISEYIPDLVSFKNDILFQLMVDDSNLSDPDGYGYIDLKKYKLPAETNLYHSICEFIFYESPELFRVTGFVAELGGKNESLLVGLSTSYIYENPTDYVRDYNKAIANADKLLEGIEGNNSLSDVEKALLLHDRLALFCEYDFVNLENDTLPDKAFNIYGTLGEGISVCMGYALAYDYLLERVGIESQYCASNALEHAWNIVFIDNKPYHVDVTWDDTVTTGNVSGQVLHTNFLRSTKGIKETGHKSGLFGGTDYITTPIDTTYDKYFWQDSITAFQLLDDKIYYIDSDYAAEGKYHRNGRIIALDDAYDTTPEVITEITGEWVDPIDNEAWLNNFSKLAVGNGVLYYSASDSVLSYNPKTKEQAMVISPEEVKKSAGEGYAIYGLEFSDCTLSGEYAIAPEYYEAEKPAKPFSKKIHTRGESWRSIASPTETKSGKVAVTCVNCNYVFEEKAVPALGNHRWGDWHYEGNIKPTCTNSAKRVKSCQDSGCNAQIWENVSALGHNYSSSFTVDTQADCASIGVKSRHCTRCDSKIDLTRIPTTETHVAGGSWLIGKTATCKADGYKYKKCVVCGDVAETIVIPRTEHNINTYNARSATCTVNGYTGDKRCKNCGTYFEYGTVIKAPGHKPSDWIVSSYPTDGRDGYKYKECVVCYEELEGKVIKKVSSLETPVATTSNSADGIVLKWNDVANAESYIIYKRTYNPSAKKYSSWSVLCIGYEGNSYVDKSVKLGVIYSYTVRAVNGSVKSKYIAAKGLKYNVTPTVKVSNANGGVKVSWSTAANATGYTVYSSTYNTATKKWSGWTNRGTAKPAATSWVDTKAKSGTYYRYTVRACSGSTKSSYKASNTTLYLSKPDVKVINSSGGIKLSWQKIAGAKGYVIYRKDVVNGNASGWKNLGATKNGTTLSFTDKTVNSGSKYLYTVRAINGNYKSAYKESAALIYLNQPRVEMNAAAGGISVAWTQSPGAEGYVVYRRELVNGKWSGWTNLTTVDCDLFRWVDTSARAGKVYNYTVRAICEGAKSSYMVSSTKITR